MNAPKFDAVPIAEGETMPPGGMYLVIECEGRKWCRIDILHINALEAELFGFGPREFVITGHDFGWAVPVEHAIDVAEFKAAHAKLPYWRDGYANLAAMLRGAATGQPAAAE